MIHIKSSQVVFCDVDDTLVKWGSCPPEEQGTAIPITCPISRYRKAAEDELGEELPKDEEYQVGEWTEYLRPHKKHIEQLKQHKMRGHVIVIWSAGGDEWAMAVVKALKLEAYVDLVISKPTWYYDDIPCQEFMGKRIWMEDK